MSLLPHARRRRSGTRSSRTKQGRTSKVKGRFRESVYGFTGRASRYNVAVGEITHRLVAEVARRHRDEAIEMLVATLLLRATILAGKRDDVGNRRRAAALTAATSAVAYARQFLPPPSWRLSGVEVPIGDGRVDLVWVTDTDEVVFDEVKLAGAPGGHLIGGRIRRQVERYAKAGREQHGAAFVGVRLILLGAPRSSVLVDPTGRRQPLADALTKPDSGHKSHQEVTA